MKQWLSLSWYEVAVWQMLLAFLVIFLSLLFRALLEKRILTWLIKLFSKTSFRYDEMIIKALGQPLTALVLVAGLWTAFRILILQASWADETIKTWGFNTWAVSVGMITIWAAYRLVNVLAEYLDDLASKDDVGLKGHLVPLIRRSLQLLVILLGTLTVLATLNVDVAGLITGLGIGGLAIALAAQEALSNFFGSVVIFTDKPFRVGDWIQIDGKVDGTVESIGFRSTKVRTFPKTLMTVPNKLISGEIVDNWSAMNKRRVKMTIGVTYETKPEQIESLLEEVRRLLREDPGVDQEFHMVRFTDFGSSSLDILVYYFSSDITWDHHLAVRERINLKIMRAVSAAGLSFAFPTRTLYLEGDLARRMAGP
ncbi:MAG: mechanosensitive ion channel family protein, partial [Blastochloris sp.]|nr:mechanosensitive ion channel family protein [Blastochloris sp.]